MGTLILSHLLTSMPDLTSLAFPNADQPLHGVEERARLAGAPERARVGLEECPLDRPYAQGFRLGQARLGFENSHVHKCMSPAPRMLGCQLEHSSLREQERARLAGALERARVGLEERNFLIVAHERSESSLAAHALDLTGRLDAALADHASLTRRYDPVKGASAAKPFSQAAAQRSFEA